MAFCSVIPGYNSSGTCLACPIGAICNGTSSLLAAQGYWLDGSVPVRCPREEYCTGGVAQCSIRHTGDACADCAEGSAAWLDACLPCDAAMSRSVSLLAFTVLIPITVALPFALWPVNRRQKPAYSKGLFEIGVDFFQLVQVASGGGLFNTDSSEVRSYLEIASDLFSITCPWEPQSRLVSVSAGIIFATLSNAWFLVLCTTLRAFRGQVLMRSTSALRSYYNGHLTSLFRMYKLFLSVWVVTGFASLNCVRVGSAIRNLRFPYAICDEFSYRVLSGFLVLVSVVAGCGVPLYVYMQLSEIQNKTNIIAVGIRGSWRSGFQLGASKQQNPGTSNAGKAEEQSDESVASSVNPVAATTVHFMANEAQHRNVLAQRETCHSDSVAKAPSSLNCGTGEQRDSVTTTLKRIKTALSLIRERNEMHAVIQKSIFAVDDLPEEIRDSVERWGSVFLVYGPQYRLWMPTFLLLRRTLLFVLNSCLDDPNEPRGQTMTTFALLVVFCCFQVRLHPFLNAVDNAYADIGMLLLVLISGFQVALDDPRQVPDQAESLRRAQQTIFWLWVALTFALLLHNLLISKSEAYDRVFHLVATHVDDWEHSLATSGVSPSNITKKLSDLVRTQISSGANKKNLRNLSYTFPHRERERGGGNLSMDLRTIKAMATANRPMGTWEDGPNVSHHQVCETAARPDSDEIAQDGGNESVASDLRLPALS